MAYNKSMHSLEKDTLLALDPIFYHITSPWLLVDTQGRVQAANPAGEPWRNIFEGNGETGKSKANPESNDAPCALHWQLQTPLTTLAILPYLLNTDCRPSWPTWLPLENALIKVQRLVEQDGIQQGFLEIFPEAGQEKLRFFQDVSQAVNSSLILEDIFESLGDVLQAYLPYQDAAIVILDESQNGIKTLVRFSSQGALEISGEHHTFAGYEPLVDTLLRSPQSRRYTRDELPNSFLLPNDAMAALVAPLISKGVVIGLIALATDKPNGFSSYHEELLNEVSAQLAVGVENARLYWQTQAQAGREFLINQLTRSIRQSLDIESILGTAVNELGKVMGVSRCAIQYFPPSTTQDEPKTRAQTQTGNESTVPSLQATSEEKLFHYQMPRLIAQPEDLALLQQAEQAIFRKRRDSHYNPFILNDVRDCPPDWIPQSRFEAAGIKSLAVIPILIRDTLVGTMSLHQCDAYRAWVMEDIELLKAMAEHLGVALNQAQLFLALDQRTHDLERTLEELQQAQLYLVQSEKMAMLGQFVAGIAHEVNTPLGTMVSNNATLTTCLEKLKPLLRTTSLEPPTTSATHVTSDNTSDLNVPIPPSKSNNAPPVDAVRLLAGMDSLFSLNKLAGDRIQEIVRNLRNFARLDESELKRVDLHEGIDSTILLLKSGLDARIQWVRQYSPELPLVQCFPGLLNQVFMNLMVNAGHALQEATDADPKRLDQTPMTITIETHWDSENAIASVTVRDNGKGIAPAHLAKVFDPGFTTKGVGVGTGLGLALCYRIVEKHNGRLLVESPPGQGASFTVRLPVTGQ
jgi:two-component system, NtrC family, sensor kinase